MYSRASLIEIETPIEKEILPNQRLEGFKIKRYLLFVGRIGEQKGGWNDYKGDFDTIRGCLLQVRDYHREINAEWFQIIDLKQGIMVRRSSINPLGFIGIKDKNENDKGLPRGGKRRSKKIE